MIFNKFRNVFIILCRILIIENIKFIKRGLLQLIELPYRLRYQKYIVGKVESVQDNIKKKFEIVGGVSISTSVDVKAAAYDATMFQFIEKFNAEDTSR